MKDLGDLHFFLGIGTSTALVLTQTKYTLDLLTRTHMQDSKLAGIRLTNDESHRVHSGPY